MAEQAQDHMSAWEKRYTRIRRALRAMGVELQAPMIVDGEVSMEYAPEGGEWVHVDSLPDVLDVLPRLRHELKLDPKPEHQDEIHALPAGIHDLTDEDWEAVRRDAKARFADIIAHAEHPRRVSEVQARAYLEAAAALWAAMAECERDVLCERGDWGPSATFAAAGYLRGSGLHRWTPTPDGGLRSERTPLGRAVARTGGAR